MIAINTCYNSYSDNNKKSLTLLILLILVRIITTMIAINTCYNLIRLVYVSIK